jgi:DNA-directed RNA polymerase subunit RPC12/RpoP
MASGNMTTYTKLSLALNRSITERSLLEPWQWCERNLHFNEAGNRGQFTTIGAEYVREVLNDFGDSTVADEVLVWGSQTRKTGTLMGGAAWCVVNDPCGFMWAMPSLTLAQKFARQRWLNMLAASPVCVPYIPTGAKRHDFATLTQILGSATFNFVGSNSAANLSSNPCRRTIGDEVDKFQDGGNKEASALNLLEQRTKGQVNPQRWKTSTPTLDSGMIWQEYLKGDQRRYFVPCPNCSKEVLFAWSKRMTAMPILGCEAFIKWDEDAKDGGEWDLDQVRDSAHCVCPHCSGKILDENKPAMIAKGKWRATNSKGATGFRSRHLSSLYSTMPETRFGALAVKFLQAKRSILGLQGFINGDLAEPFVDQDRQAKRTEGISDKIEFEGKPGVMLMTIDCQQLAPYFWWLIRVWFDGGSVAIAAGSAETWEELRGIQQRHKVADAGVFVDSGQGKEATNIYRKCANYGSEVFTEAGSGFVTWMPCKGFHIGNAWRNRETGALTLVRLGAVDPFIGTSEANATTIPLLEFLSEAFKDILQRLREGKDIAFKWSVSREVATEEYWRHMDGELKRHTQNRKTGRMSYEWVKRGKTWPNHWLDCEVMQLAAATNEGLINELNETP